MKKILQNIRKMGFHNDEAKRIMNFYGRGYITFYECLLQLAEIWNEEEFS